MVLKREQVMRIVKGSVAAIFLILVLRAFCGGHFLPRLATRLQAAPAFLRSPWFAVPAFLALTAVFGRFFCEMMCPLGILQSLAHFITHPRKALRRVCTRLPETRAQRIVRWSVVALFLLLLTLGFGALAWSVEPYSIFGRALTGLQPFPWILGGILILAAATSGRIWCNWICPFGTLFNLVSRVAPYGNRICGRCAHCRKCFPKAAEKKTEEPKEEGVTRRETIQGLALVAAAEAAFPPEVAGTATSVHNTPSVLPPGARSHGRFTRTCLSCGLCLPSCPTGALVRSDDWRTYGQPKLDFTKGICELACDQQCAQACPAGALIKISDVARHDVHIGRAVWHPDRCLRKTTGETCTICQRLCPVNAIAVVGKGKGGTNGTMGTLFVDELVCVGCGACEHGCAANPEPAIIVEGLDVHHVVRPMNEGDLIEAMMQELDTTKIAGERLALVTAKGGVISQRKTGRGVKPLLDLLDAEQLEGVVLVDRVIGRAAAAICVAGGVRRVYAKVMSRDAAAYLREHGVSAGADDGKAERIYRNVETKELCPMEATVLELEDPLKMVAALRRKIREMSRR